MKDTSGMSRRGFLGLMGAGAAMAVAAPLSAATKSARASKAMGGVVPIAFTPARPAGKVDFDGLASQVEFLKRGAVHGVAWPKIASGWTTLDESDRIKGAEVMVQAARGGNTKVI